jgi:hypothetical protein
VNPRLIPHQLRTRFLRRSGPRSVQHGNGGPKPSHGSDNNSAALRHQSAERVRFPVRQLQQIAILFVTEGKLQAWRSASA